MCVHVCVCVLLPKRPCGRGQTSWFAVGAMAAEPELAAEVAQLRARVAELEQQLQRTGSKREKINRMSAEVVDSNPYR